MDAYKYYLIVLLEGGAVLLSELVSAKLLAPYFGTSIMVWASTLGVTLGGLTFGYFLGSYLCQKNPEKKLPTLLIVASILISMMPFIAKWSLSNFIDLNIGLGSSLALLVYLFPVLCLLGCVSPIVVNILGTDDGNAGKVAGKVFGISTLGGILFVYLTGFLFIPSFGLKTTCIIAAIFLFIAAVIAINSRFKLASVLSLLIFIFICSSIYSFRYKPVYNDHFKVLYEDDGLMGNLKVIDHTSEDFTAKPKLGRGLVMNNTLQSYMDLKGPGISIWDWAHFIPSIAGIKGRGQKSLILGMGGGTIYKQFKLMDHEIDVVEIDKRVADLSIKYFKIPDAANIYIGDGRHYLKTCQKKYDIISYDAFMSESPAEHLLTKEGFKDALNCLNNDGMMIINFFGFLSGENGYAARSITKTLLDLDLNVDLVPTPGKEEYRNLLFVVSRTTLPPYESSIYNEPGRRKITSWKRRVIRGKSVNTFEAEVLTDERPILSKLFRKPAESWRKGYNEIYTKKLFK